MQELNKINTILDDKIIENENLKYSLEEAGKNYQ